MTSNQTNSTFFPQPSGGSGGGTVMGSGTLDYISKWTPDGLTLGNSLLFDDGTNVGIGTTSPLALFNVLSAGGSGMGIRVTGTNSGLYPSIDYVNDQGGTGFQTGLYGSANGAGYNNNAFFYNGIGGGGIGFWTATVQRLFIASGGNVGIGTGLTAPAHKLDVNGTLGVASLGTFNDRVNITGTVTTGTGTSSDLSVVSNSLTTGNAVDISSNSITSGTLIKASTSATGTANYNHLVLQGANNGSVSANITNTSAGTNAQALLQFSSNTSLSQLFKLGSNFLTYKNLSGSDFGIYNTTAGNISFLNDYASGNINFAAGGSSTPQLTLSTTGLLISTGGITSNVAHNHLGTSEISNINDATNTITAFALGTNIITVGAKMVPDTNNAYDLGLTGTRWKNLWLSGNGDITGTLGVTGTTTLNSGSGGIVVKNYPATTFGAIYSTETVTPGAGNYAFLTSDTSAVTVVNVKSGGSILFRENDGTTVRINSGGNVSIGNANNTYKLDVTGTANISTSITSPILQVTSTGIGVLQFKETTTNTSNPGISVATALGTLTTVFHSSGVRVRGADGSYQFGASVVTDASDVNISRNAVGILQIGTTTNNASGSLLATNLLATGNIGLGTTTFATWDAGINTIQGPSKVASLGLDVTDTYFSTNAYYNGGWKYVTTAPTANYSQTITGDHIWRVAASGTAGTAITWNNAMYIDPSGNVGIGTASPSYKFEVFKLSNTADQASIAGSIFGTDGNGPTLRSAVSYFISSNAQSSIYLNNISGGGIGISGNGSAAVAATSALVDIQSTTKGLLIPRMTTTQMNAISSPATGLRIYNTTDNVDYFYNGTSWLAVNTSLGGTYTPTLTNTTNVTSSTAIVCHYTRIGNQVSVTGSVGVVTTLAVSTVLSISLPISSNFAATTDLAGVGQASSAIAANAFVQGNTTSDLAELTFTGLSVGGNGTIFFTFTYTII